MSEQLQQLLEMIAQDDELRERLTKETHELTNLGWSPEAAASFHFETKEKKYPGCGSVCGCGALEGEGGTCVCTNSGGSGAGKRPGEE
jgi:hypothetical protein